MSAFEIILSEYHNQVGWAEWAEDLINIAPLSFDVSRADWTMREAPQQNTAAFKLNLCEISTLSSEDLLCLHSQANV